MLKRERLEYSFIFYIKDVFILDRKWNLETMNEWCDLNSDGYKVLEVKWIQKPYQKQKWALMKCPNKSHELYWAFWNGHRRGHRCKQCDYESKGFIIWDKNMAFEFFKKHGYIMINIDDFKNVDETVWCYDSEGFKVRPSITNLRHGGTPSRYQYNSFAIENVQRYCKLYRPEYRIVSEKYSGVKSKYEWEYLGDDLPEDVSNKFKITIDNFIHGGCGHPYFTTSQGEKIFERELKNNKINYIKQKTFKDCKDKNRLKFDFYIPELDEIVEIDGLQHEKVITHFGGEEGFKDRVRKDEIKNNYCKLNNIKLTRIRYRTNEIPEYNLLVKECIDSMSSRLDVSTKTRPNKK